MKLLITGYKGQLGYDIVKECEKRGIDAVGVDIDEMDITNSKMVKHVITSGKYDAVIHCAAWTAVDKAEDEIELCTKVNVDGTRNIVTACQTLDIPLMYFSTDYVFNGEGEEPWNEYDKRDRLNVYGMTKYEGEKIVEKLSKHFIIRISWVFGVNGNNFVKTMLKLAEQRDELTVVNDQFGSPTYTYDLSKLAVDMIQTKNYGVYHITNEGTCSWYEFACEIFRQSNLDIKVIPVSGEEFLTKAKRPKNSRMNKTELDKNGFSRLRSWEDALYHFLSNIDIAE